MKRSGIFAGMLLVYIGSYFLLQPFHFPFSDRLFSWPTLLILAGIALLMQSYLTRQQVNLFPGTLLFGFGIHFHAAFWTANWPSHWLMFTLSNPSISFWNDSISSGRLSSSPSVSIYSLKTNRSRND